MLYKRSSFIRWLINVKDCNVVPIGDEDKPGALVIWNGPIKKYMGTDRKDRIDYEEIYLVCRNLMIDGLPGDKELERID